MLLVSYSQLLSSPHSSGNSHTLEQLTHQSNELLIKVDDKATDRYVQCK